MSHGQHHFLPLNTAILTVSDTRTPENDASGDYLADQLDEAGHRVVVRDLVRDDRYVIRARVAGWIADATVSVVLITGGTGLYERDVTPEAVLPLLDREIPGFGEYFRAVSAGEIGVATIQSRAIAGIANRTLVCALPGSTNACRTAWKRILSAQLDARHQPCNFVDILGVVPASLELTA